VKFAIVIAEKYSRLDYRDVSRNALLRAKECILDYIGCTYAGIPLTSSKIVKQFASENYKRGECTVIGCGEKLVPAGACFVNSTTGHGVELDDVSKIAVLHVGVVVIPVAIAIAEKLGLGGKEVLSAIISGYDVVIKIGKAADPQSHLARGFHPTSTCGMFGSAITASQLMELTTDQTANALGIVGSFVAGNLECYSDGSLTKRLQPGIASSSGVVAADLASKGYTGPKSILEGPRGFFHAYCDNNNIEELTKGGNYEIEDISFKPHACCGFNQSPVDAALEIRAKNKIDYREVGSILVELARTGYEIVGQPDEIKHNPKNSADGQFSAPYSVAVACIDGKAFLEEYSENSVQRPDIRELMAKISVKHSPDLDRHLPEAFPARVTISMKHGETYSKEVVYAKGDPQNPLSWGELLQKFNTLVREGKVDENRKKQIIETIEQFEEVRDIKEFTKLVR
jgi:2-methylcitrate dehydratase PrpD